MRAFQQKLKLHQTFSGLNARSSDFVDRGDIEDQVIDVSELPQDGFGHFYKTNFLGQSSEGGDIGVIFFRKLDEELNKVNTFYKDKVTEVIKEADELNKQMDALIALRIKVEGKQPSADNATSVHLNSTSSLAGSQSKCTVRIIYFLMCII